MTSASATPTRPKKATKSPTIKAPVSIDAAIRAQVKMAKDGKIFSPVDFAGLGSRAAVDKVLSRLTASGELRRIARGLYDQPRTHPLLGSLLPAADEIARALAGKGSLRLQPSGAYAANLLGLSEQVPLKLVFLTDGASRKVKVGNQQITLKHTTPRNMATAGRISGLVIQALRYLKQSNIDEQVVVQLRKRLSKKQKVEILADAPLAPIWIADIMRQIANGEG
ncbi:MAG: DUF6088 family protein [Pseudomonadota bacterium]